MIYLLEDDDNIRNFVTYALNNSGLLAEGFDVPSAFWKAVEKEKPSMAILDIMLPEEDGLSVMRKLRNRPDTKDMPIMMLTAKSTEYDKVLGLDGGADDYVTKPFGTMELIARVKSQLRRYVRLGSLSGQNEGRSSICTTGGLVIDDEQKSVTLDGEQIPVTPTEYGILKFLTSNAGKVFSIEQIYEAVWNEPAYSAENTVAVHIRRIREKIEIDPKNPQYLKVVWGIGYKIEKI